MKPKEERGITLVALVVTIVVLLILAGITINLILGQNSIFNMAQKAGEEMNKAVEDEQGQFGNLTNWLNNEGYLNSTGGNGGSGGTGENPNPGGEENPPTPEVPKGPNGKPLVGTVTTPNNSGNTEVEDKNGNPITIPAGFTVLPNGEDGVEYNHDEENHSPCVEDGIVVQDSSR